MSIDSYYEQYGCGDPIVFIHGSYASTSTWKSVVEHLAPDYHCICIKLPGHCGTPDPDDFAKPNISTELSILQHVVAKLTDRPIHLVGHSYGGVVALSQAIKDSIPISQMSLFEPVACWVFDAANDEQMHNRVQMFTDDYLNHFTKDKNRACAKVIDFWAGDGAFDSLPDFIQSSMTPLVENNVRHWKITDAFAYTLNDLASLDMPTRVICGDQSNPVAGAIAKHLTTHIPNSEMRIIAGASHFLLSSHPEQCLDALMA